MEIVERKLKVCFFEKKCDNESRIKKSGKCGFQREVVYLKTYARKTVESGKLLEERSVKVECISIKLSVLISRSLASDNYFAQVLDDC